MSVQVRVHWENEGKSHTGTYGLLTEKEDAHTPVDWGDAPEHHVRFVDRTGRFFGIESSAIISIFVVEEQLPKEKQPHVG